MDPLTILALVALGYVMFFYKPKAKAPSVEGAPAQTGRHAGHVLYEAFEACEKDAIGDRLKSTIGAKGADSFMDKLGGYVGTNPSAAPVPNAPPSSPPAAG